jgi:gliding motility-associated-like protein
MTGCELSDEVTVFVIEKGKYFIANIFSPNGDEVNDVIGISATPGIKRVNRWIIFDRWGDAVYGKLDFDPFDPAVKWDGRTSTGEFANPGVFPYIIEYQLINGKTELRHGNITLIR